MNKFDVPASSEEIEGFRPEGIYSCGLMGYAIKIIHDCGEDYALYRCQYRDGGRIRKSLITNEFDDEALDSVEDKQMIREHAESFGDFPSYFRDCLGDIIFLDEVMRA